MRSEKQFPRLALLILLVIPIHGLGAVNARAGSLIERTLAFVNKKPVLLTDVALTRALLQLGEADGLERTIDESLMFEEASRLLNEPPSEETVVTASLALQEKAGKEFSMAALRRKALVQLAIANYIEFRLRPLVRVEDADVRRTFNEKVVSESQPPAFSLVAPGIREVLEKRSLDQKIEEWVASLRLRAEIRRPAAPKG